MSGLADELLADLDGLSDNGSVDYEENQDASAPTTSSTPNGLKRKADDDLDMPEAEEEEDAAGEESGGGLVLEGGVKPAEELDAEDVQQMDLGAIEDVSSIAKLESSKKMTDILKANLVLSIFSYWLLMLVLCRKLGNTKQIQVQQMQSRFRPT